MFAPRLSSKSDTLTLSSLQHGLVQQGLDPCSMQLHLDASMTWHRWVAEVAHAGCQAGLVVCCNCLQLCWISLC
jgi:hypothetical protein